MALLVFSPNGEKVREIPMMGPKRRGHRWPHLRALGHQHALVTDLEGNPLGQWGTNGRGEENLDDLPGSLKKRIIYIGDLNNTRVLALSPDLSTSGSTVDQPSRPKSTIRACSLHRRASP